jgi:ankyrin repeat protein
MYDAKDPLSFGNTPLIVAAHLGNVPMARLLLEHGAPLIGTWRASYWNMAPPWSD